jgi:hypothetical protein
MSEEIKLTVPKAVLKAFEDKFGKIKKVEWEMEEFPPCYEAEFKIGEKEHEAYFRADGKFLKLETKIEFEEIPQEVIDSFAERYPNHGIIEAEKVEMADGEILFEIDAVRQFVAQFREDGVFTAEMDED